MNLAQFLSKAVTNKPHNDVVVSQAPFAEICAFISDGVDSEVANLIAGLWKAKPAFTEEQILQAIACALFPGKGYMRCATSSSAFMLAKAAGCQTALQKAIKEQWGSITERGCNEVVLGLSYNKDFAEWHPVLVSLFALNEDNDIRTQVVRIVNNNFRATEAPEARQLLGDLLKQMPSIIDDYSNRDNFQFVKKLKAEH